MRLQTRLTPPTPSELVDRDDHARGDPRFRTLLPERDWARLPPPVRRRFSKRLADGEATVFVGEVREARLSWLGRVFVQAARLVGAPLPTSDQVALPVVVTVTDLFRLTTARAA